MSRLFEATEIKGMVLSNRFVRSATWEGMATEDGASTVQLVNLLEKLAAGGVGLIIASVACARRDGHWVPGQLGIDKDELVDGFRVMTKAVHEQGVPLLSQIGHAGVFADPKLTGQVGLGVSEIDDVSDRPRRKVSVETIQEIVKDFGRAAKRAKRSGFDGVQIFAAHGYLFSQFLSPAFN